MALHLTLHTPPVAPLEVAALTPDRLAGLSAAEIAALPLRHGNQAACLSDFFRVTGDGSGDGEALEVIVEGDLRRVKGLGAGMTRGRLWVKGSAGMHVGAGMQGGELIVDGDAGDWAGAEMSGGRLLIRGNAGDLAGAAYRGSRKGMLGGELIIAGNVGAETGYGLRRGLIAVGGDCGDFAGAHMLAGTILVFGALGQRAGLGMRRGSIIGMRPTRLLPTFNFDCRYRPTFLRLYLNHARAAGLPVSEAHLNNRYARWSGDMLELGRGEILILEPA